MHSIEQVGNIGVNMISVRSKDVGIDGIVFARVTAGSHNTMIKMFSQKSE